nr:tetraspanin [Hymenolepis microstoma]
MVDCYVRCLHIFRISRLQLRCLKTAAIVLNTMVIVSKLPNVEPICSCAL